jgi:hypothetical protein
MEVPKLERLKIIKEEAATLRRLNAMYWISTSHTEAETKAHEARISASRPLSTPPTDVASRKPLLVVILRPAQLSPKDSAVGAALSTCCDSKRKLAIS